MNKLKETAPERIWLYVKKWLCSGDEEIRWSRHVMNDGVEYVRADIAEQQSIIIKQQAKEIEALTAERQRGLNFDALNKRIDVIFSTKLKRVTYEPD